MNVVLLGRERTEPQELSPDRVAGECSRLSTELKAYAYKARAEGNHETAKTVFMIIFDGKEAWADLWVEGSINWPSLRRMGYQKRFLAWGI